MNTKTGIYYFLSALLAVYMVVFVYQKNFEFLIYIFSTAVLLGLIWWSDGKFDYSTIVVSGFGSWLVLHLLAGSVKVGEDVLYKFMILPLVGEPYHILKFDQFMHFFCYLVVAMLLYDIAKKTIGGKGFALAFIVVLAACGVGAFNEIIEFAAVVIVGETGVGGYINNALDLVFNLMGAIVGVSIMSKKK